MAQVNHTHERVNLSRSDRISTWVLIYGGIACAIDGVSDWGELFLPQVVLCVRVCGYDNCGWLWELNKEGSITRRNHQSQLIIVHLTAEQIIFRVRRFADARARALT